MKYLILSACFFLLISSGCKKNRTQKPKTELEKLPPVTQTGANTFGCLINGEAFIPGGGGLFDKILNVHYDENYGAGSLNIKATMYSGGNVYIISILGNVNNTGEYELLFRGDYGVFYSTTFSTCSFNTFDPPQPNKISGLLNILKFNKVSKTIAGTFSFKINTDQCGEIEATDGRFDVQY